MMGRTAATTRYNVAGKIVGTIETLECGKCHRVKDDTGATTFYADDCPVHGKGATGTPQHTFIRNNLGSLALHVASKEETPLKVAKKTGDKKEG